MTHDRAILLGSHQLNKGLEVTAKDDAIIEIHITRDE